MHRGKERERERERGRMRKKSISERKIAENANKHITENQYFDALPQTRHLQP
jgi:hypothetical protein